MLPLVNIIAEVSNEIRRRGYRRVALFGTRDVVESRMFGLLEDVEVMVPPQVDAIHEAYMQIVNEGAGGTETLTQIAKELPVDAVAVNLVGLMLVSDCVNRPDL